MVCVGARQRRRAPLVRGLLLATELHLEAPIPVCLTKQGERPDPYVGPHISSPSA